MGLTVLVYTYVCRYRQSRTELRRWQLKKLNLLFNTEHHGISYYLTQICFLKKEESSFLFSWGRGVGIG